MSVKKDVSDLILWYRQHKPEVKVIAVNAAAATLRRFCKKKRKGPFMFEGFEIVPTRKAKKDQIQPEQVSI
jgi:hypothetical protein